MRVLAVDLGFRVGFGALGGQSVRSGSFPIKGSAKEMGLAFRSLEALVDRLIMEYKPDVVGVAVPFIGRLTQQPEWNKRASRRVTPDTILVVYGLFAKLQEIVDKHALRFERVHEPDARKAFTGFAGGKSEEIKKRVQSACAQRLWVATDNHAADALCIADFVFNSLNPKQAHKTSPLFLSAGLARARAKASV